MKAKPNQKSLLAKMQEIEPNCEKRLGITQENFANHVVESHHGKPATSCHTCIGFRNLLRVQQMDLTELLEQVK